MPFSPFDWSGILVMLCAIAFFALTKFFFVRFKIRQEGEDFVIVENGDVYLIPAESDDPRDDIKTLAHAALLSFFLTVLLPALFWLA